jgi:hypothetical protein
MYSPGVFTGSAIYFARLFTQPSKQSRERGVASRRAHLEEIMKKHTLLVTMAALALGIALSVPASAQSRAPNDGGQAADVPAGAKLDSGASKSTASSAPAYGRGANDGGPGAEPTAAQLKGASAQNKTANQSPAAFGRGANEGGSIR